MLKTAALLSAICLAACVPQGPEAVSDALPTADDVQVKVPEDGAQALALGQIADYYRFTRVVSRDFNGGAAWVLTLVHVIVQFPPTEVDGNTYTWGPHSDALDPAEWKLVVTENADGSYDWRFDGRSKTELNSSFLTVISGNAVPGDVPHRGNGNFMIDFDAGEQVNPIDNDASGRVEVSYDLRQDGDINGSISMHIAGRQETEGGDIIPVTADYAYSENLDGSGDFSFAIKADLDENGSAAEDALIRSRWQADGAGRGDARLSGGNLEALVVEASECWDAQFRRVHYTDSVDWAPTEGDAADCAFTDVLLP